MKDQELFIDTQEHPLIIGHRRRAWEKFLHLDKSPSLPTENFKRAENKQFSQEEILAFIPEHSKHSYIVFINGWFCQELSDISAIKKGILLPLKDAAKTFASLVLGALSKTSIEEQKHAALLNTSLHTEGAFLYIPPKSVFEEPLFILSLIATKDHEWVMPKLQIFVGASSLFKIQRQARYASGSSCFYNSVIDLYLEERSLVDVISDDFATKGYTGWYFDTVNSQLKSHSTFSHLQLATEVSSSYDLQVTLAGEGADATMSGLSLLSQEKTVTTNIQAKHKAPSCRSMQLYKNILAGSSQAHFQGKIFVSPEAQKTESYQLTRSLLLSHLATSKSEPNLEIFADDVKASHGSTSGQLDDEALFYLSSRGVEAKAARRMLLEGFTQEITQKSFSEEQKGLFSQLLESYEVT